MPREPHARIIYAKDLFDPEQIETRSHSGPLIDYLEERFPDGFGARATRVFVYGDDGTARALDVDEYADAFPGKTVVVAHVAGLGIDVIIGIIVSIVLSVVSALLSYLLFKPPKLPTRADTPEADPVYNFAGRQNRARLGESYPVVYGRVTTIPDLIAQPYRYYRDNVEYTVYMLGITYGYCHIDSVMIGESPESKLPPNAIRWTQHKVPNNGTGFGQLELAQPFGPDVWFYEDVQTSGEVTDQELDKADGNRYPTISATVRSDGSSTLIMVTNPGFPVQAGTEVRMWSDAHPEVNGTRILQWADVTRLGFDSPIPAVGSAPIEWEVWGYYQTRARYVMHHTNGGYTVLYYDYTTFVGASQPALNPRVWYPLAEYGPGQTVPGAFPGKSIYLDSVFSQDGAWHGKFLVRTQELYYPPAGTERDVLTQLEADAANPPLPPANLAPEEIIGEPLVQARNTVTLSVWAQTPAYTMNLEAISPEASIGWFVLGKRDRITRTVMVDIVWPGGQYVSNDDGSLRARTTQLVAELQQIDENGNVLWYQSTDLSYTHATVTPQRVTQYIDIPSDQYRQCRVQVRIRRKDGAAAAEQREASRVIVTALRAVLSYWDSQFWGRGVYNGLTIMPLIIRADDGVSASGAQIRVQCQRLLPDRFQSGPAMTDGPMGSFQGPVDAFVDIFVDDYVGGNRPRDELDYETLVAVRNATWPRTPSEGFNGVFTTTGTVWDALERSVQGIRAAPLAVFNKTSLMVSEPTPRRMLFTPENIERGTFSVLYDFTSLDEIDGYEVKWRDQDLLNERSVFYPEAAVRPETVDLFGCTDENTAKSMARYLWQKYVLQRKMVKFTATSEGLILTMNDRFGVAHPLPDWGNSCRVEKIITPQYLKLDKPALTTSGYLFLRDEQAHVNDNPIGWTRQADWHEIVLDAPPPFKLFDYESNQEPTYVALSDRSDFVQDFLTLRRVPRPDGTVLIEGVAYDEAIWDNL